MTQSITRSHFERIQTASSTLGVAIVGAGGIAERHRRAITASDRAALVSVFDPAHAAAEKLAHKSGWCEVLDSYEKVLSDPRVDLVYICSPNHLHAQQTIAALTAGKHVFVEKPLAINDADAAKVAEAVVCTKRLLLVGYHYRFLPAYRKARQWLDDGAIGQVWQLEDRIVSDYRVGQRPAWFLDPKRAGGGVLMNNGGHQLDRVCWLLGALPSAIYSRIGYRFPGIHVDSDASVDLQFADNLRARVFISGLPGEVENHIKLFGTTGQITIDYRGHVTLHRGDHIERQEQHADPLHGAECFLDTFVHHHHDNCLDTITELPDAAWGRYILKLMRAIYAADGSKQWSAYE